MLIHTSPLSWQLEQPLVTPAWICAVVGTGIANLLPGAVMVAFAGTSPAGTEPAWQLSQAVAEGICEVAPTGEVGGITTILLMPTNEAPVIVGPWHPTQVVSPLWLIAEFVNFAPFGTGVAAMLEPAPTWQDSHAAVVGMWVAGIPTIEKLAAGIAKLGAALPWHCAQLLLVLGAYKWMFATVGITAKSLLVWQFAQFEVVANGMWFDGNAPPVAVLNVAMTVWHVLHWAVVGM
jgi:hypothetical protein